MAHRFGATSFILISIVAVGCSEAPHMVSRPSNSTYDRLTVPEASSPVGPDYSEGREILQKARIAYNDLDSYSGTIQLDATAKFPADTLTEQRTFRIRFKRPGSLRFEGQDSNKHPFVISIDGNSATVRWNGETEQFKSAQEALFAYSGVSLFGTFVLPGCLLDIVWNNDGADFPKNKSLIEAWATKARLEGSAQVGTSDCHKIVCERDTATWTLFVSKTSLLIMRADYEITEKQMDRLRSIGLGGGASGNLLALWRSQIFTIEELNGSKK